MNEHQVRTAAELERAAQLLEEFYRTIGARPDATTAAEQWWPMSVAPRDGSPVLLLTLPDLPDRCAGYRSIQFVGANHGDFSQWCFAAPVGVGGFPDAWFVGWRALRAGAARPPEAIDHHQEQRGGTAPRADECVGYGRGGAARCCDRAGEYDGFRSGDGPAFTCPERCSCHD